MLLGLTGYQREVTMLNVLAASIFIATVAAQPVLTATDLAQRLAMMQLLYAGAAAMLLAARSGIWPGLTALLFRQIRLL